MRASDRFLAEVQGPPITEIPSGRWIFDRIEEWARRSPDRFAFAVDHQQTVEQYGYADVLKQAESIARGLAASDIQQGDRVGVLMENIPQWVFVFLGAMRLGAITVPLATTLPEPAMRRIIEHSGCKILFADAQNLEKAFGVAGAAGCPVVAFGSSDARATAWDEFQTRSPKQGIRDAFDPSGDETALLIYTSGTTGDPKGVQLTISNLVYEIRGVVEPLAISPEHRILSVLPFSHVLPLIANGIGPLCLGAGVVFLSSITPQRITEAFHRHRISLFVCVPQFFYLLHKRIFAQVASQSRPLRVLFNVMFAIAKRVNSPSLRRKMFSELHKAVGPNLQLLASGGSTFDVRVARDLSNLGYVMLNAYGLTETSAAVTATLSHANRIGTVGKPIRGVTIRIDSPNSDGIGEVWIRGPLLMKGYYRDEAATAQAIKDGWFHTGDLGFIHPDGNLAITGRSKDVIVLANGENIYPEEIETYYSQSPFIKEICVVGVAGNGAGPAGEKLHAIVVPDMDEFRSRRQTGIMETIRFEVENISKQLPSFHRLHSVDLRNEPFPRTVTRKLKRFEIIAEEASARKSNRRAGRPAEGTDHSRFSEGIGLVIAELVREVKADVGALDPSLNLELDLGFDSLARVELLGNAEARLGVHIDEEKAARLYTLGELADAFEAARPNEAGTGRNWSEILSAQATESLNTHYILDKRTLLNPLAFVYMRVLKTLARLFFKLKYVGLDKLPKSGSFLLCPNHESFLDGPFLCSVLPRGVTDRIFVLGYSDYWESPVARRVARACNIVAVDPNVNLVRAMQIGALGLRHNKVLLVFPEGTRTIDGHIQEFKKGAAILAREVGVPIVPVGIRGTFEAWPRGGSFKFHPAEVVFGEPIYPQSLGNVPDAYSRMTERLQDDVRILSGDL